MQPEINPVETGQANPIHQVTNLSKYFAMLLFITMPFVGGWVGYNYAPEKIVVNEILVEKQIQSEEVLTNIPENVEYASTTNPSNLERYTLDRSVCVYPVTNNYSGSSQYPCFLLEKQVGPNQLVTVFENLTDEYRKTHPDLMIDELYKPESGEAVYFKTYNQNKFYGYGVTKFTFATLQFEDIGEGIIFTYDGHVSPDGKYIAQFIFNLAEGSKKIRVIQTVDGEVVRDIKAGPHESLESGMADDGAPTASFEWLGNRVLQYDVYEPSYDEDSFLESRTVKLP